jgi:hypothetical protein
MRCPQCARPQLAEAWQGQTQYRPRHQAGRQSQTSSKTSSSESPWSCCRQPSTANCPSRALGRSSVAPAPRPAAGSSRRSSRATPWSNAILRKILFSHVQGQCVLADAPESVSITALEIRSSEALCDTQLSQNSFSVRNLLRRGFAGPGGRVKNTRSAKHPGHIVPVVVIVPEGPLAPLATSASSHGHRRCAAHARRSCRCR